MNIQQLDELCVHKHSSEHMLEVMEEAYEYCKSTLYKEIDEDIVNETALIVSKLLNLNDTMKRTDLYFYGQHIAAFEQMYELVIPMLIEYFTLLDHMKVKNLIPEICSYLHPDIEVKADMYPTISNYNYNTQLISSIHKCLQLEPVRAAQMWINSNKEPIVNKYLGDTLITIYKAHVYIHDSNVGNQNDFEYTLREFLAKLDKDFG